MAKCNLDHDELRDYARYLKVGSRYYCPECGGYLGADPPPSMNLPRTWWRTVKGDYRFSGGC